MVCKHFGECGSCKIYEEGYEAQLGEKIKGTQKLFVPFTDIEYDVFLSPHEGFRFRSEFKIYHDNGDIYYAMYNKEKRLFKIDECLIVNSEIQKLFTPLLQQVKKLNIAHKLFAVEFLSTTTKEMIITLIYHRKLDEEWEKSAKTLLQELQVEGIIGRSRKQKIVIEKDRVVEDFSVNEKIYKFVYIENSFTQPNPYTNRSMLQWVSDQSRNIDGDLLELYCGAGNFTLILSEHFERVLATEISKTSIAAARKNCEINDITNIEFIRMSSEDFVQASNKVREFNRLKEIDLESYTFSSVFVDPPRSGLDDTTRDLASKFENILYISCNPETLARDVEYFKNTHKIVAMAFFDQFAYTPHLEMGLHLVKK